MSTIKANKWENPDGTENYKCRAWVNFDGSAIPPTIRASGNVSSVTRTNTGDYTINFTNSMPSTNYAVVITVGLVGASSSISFTRDDVAARTASAVRINTRNLSGTAGDSPHTDVAVFN